LSFYLKDSSRFNALERSRFANASSYQELQDLEEKAFRLPLDEKDSEKFFKVRTYKSGEISGAYYTAGSKSKVKPPERSGPVVSAKSKAKIRRAVENTGSELTTFLTLTFSPWDLRPWEVHHYAPVPSRGRGFYRFGLTRFKRFREIDPAVAARRLCLVIPVVHQEYAKYRLKNFRNALNMKVNRQIKCKLKELSDSEHEEYTYNNKFRMVWTAELQANGNIHFHMLTNKYWAKSYLAKVWPYGYSNIKRLKDAEHAAYYMVKYISKDEASEIRGNRYNISAILREESKPMSTLHLEDKEAANMRKMINVMKEEIEKRGGRVIDSGFGFNFPHPRRSRPYKAKDGTTRRTRAISKRELHEPFLDACFPVPF
jgi:hypothetical protein